MSEVLLKVDGLKKSFGGVVATDDVNLDVRLDEVHAIIGPNGAGKTTLITQLFGEQFPDAGKVYFKGNEVTKLPIHKRSGIGLARSFQITSVFMDFTVLDNVALAVQAHQGHSFKFWKPATTQVVLRQGAMDALVQVGLQDRASTKASELSHGERRQLEIAMALATNPVFLLLDEPMAGMGTEETALMVTLLKSLKQGRAILLVEHDMNAVFELADRISVLVYGKLIATGTPDEIRANKDVREAYLGEA
jgi:branched-chain amino acid transport system ATP-binding protein